jgi:hypothetical protein
MSRSKKITEFDQYTDAFQDDLFILEHFTSNTVSDTGAIKVKNLFGNVSCNTNITGNAIFSANNLKVTKNTTPVSSSGSFNTRQIWFDDNYLYVSISPTTVKRVALQTF